MGKGMMLRAQGVGRFLEEKKEGSIEVEEKRELRWGMSEGQ